MDPFNQSGHHHLSSQASALTSALNHQSTPTKHQNQSETTASHSDSYNRAAQNDYDEQINQAHSDTVQRRHQVQPPSVNSTPAISQASWPAFEDIANALACDFDVSLSGLGNFIQSQSFDGDNVTSNNSDAMLQPSRSKKESSIKSAGSSSSNKRQRDTGMTMPHLTDIKKEMPSPGHESRWV